MDGVDLWGLGQGCRHVGQRPVDVGVAVVGPPSGRLRGAHSAGHQALGVGVNSQLKTGFVHLYSASVQNQCLYCTEQLYKTGTVFFTAQF